MVFENSGKSDGATKSVLLLLEMMRQTIRESALRRFFLLDVNLPSLAGEGNIMWNRSITGAIC